MNLIRRIFQRRRHAAGVVPKGTFIMEAEWERCEELRPDRLGPSFEDVSEDDQVIRAWDKDRPLRSLGPMRKG